MDGQIFTVIIALKKRFQAWDTTSIKTLWRWAKRRHPQKGNEWIRRKYFRSEGHRHWVFSATIKDAKGNKTHLDLVEASQTPIQRHIKIRAAATPYDPAYSEYFAERQARRKGKRLFRPCKESWSPWWEIESTNDE